LRSRHINYHSSLNISTQWRLGLIKFNHVGIHLFSHIKVERKGHDRQHNPNIGTQQVRRNNWWDLRSRNSLSRDVRVPDLWLGMWPWLRLGWQLKLWLGLWLGLLLGLHLHSLLGSSLHGLGMGVENGNG
jgi:hypothetical protein